MSANEDFQLQKVVPNFACNEKETEVCLTSSIKLVSFQFTKSVVELRSTNFQKPDVKARFLIYDKKTGELCSDDELWSKLVHPQCATLKNSKEFTVKVPLQEEIFLKKLQNSEMDLFITILRSSDGMLAKNFQKFEYQLPDIGLDPPILGKREFSIVRY